MGLKQKEVKIKGVFFFCSKNQVFGCSKVQITCDVQSIISSGGFTLKKILRWIRTIRGRGALTLSPYPDTWGP